MKQTIVVLQEQIPPYRVPFFRTLSAELRTHDLDLYVMSSLPPSEPDERGFGYRQVATSMGGTSALSAIISEGPAALVLPHSARFAPLASATRFRKRGGRRQLLWGMGLARRYSSLSAPADRRPVGEAIRRLMLSTCDHYLSYTEASTADVRARGFDAARITTLNNAVELLASPEQVSAAQRVPLQALFVASLAEDKQPLAAVEIVGRLRSLAPGATLHIVGDGPLRPECERVAAEHEWVRYCGPLRGSRLRSLALTSDFALIPGRVGLAVLEMASVGLPMTTFCQSLHGAEIAYLQDGINGLLLSEDVDAAAKDLAGLLTDRPAVEQMRHEALGLASRCTVQGMAASFARGVLASLL